MQTITVEANQTVVAEGSPLTCAYLVQSGVVAITMRGITQQLSTGGTFGELALGNAQTVADFTAVATEPCTLISVDPEGWNSLLGQCPPLASLFIRGTVEHMRLLHAAASTGAAPARAGKAEKSAPKIEISGVKRIAIKSNCPDFENVIRGTVEIPINRLPYKLGGFPEGGEINSTDNNNIYLPSPDNPLLISRQHCQIEVQKDALMLVDIGSRFNTTVNGVVLGRGKGVYKAPLQKGENEIRLGDELSPYCVTVIVE